MTQHLYDDFEILKYRERVASLKKSNNESNPNIDKYEDGVNDTAEDEYAKTVNGWSSVVFELTYRCSEQCIHCYNEGASHSSEEPNKRGEKKELSFEKYKEVIDELCEQGMFKACITGGDPFVNSKAWDIIEYLYHKEVSVEIYTNGQSLIGQCNRLASLYPRIVGLSVYSAIPEIHDNVTRKKGSYNKTLTVIEELSHLGIPIQLKCCVLNINFESYKSIYKLAERYNALPQIETNIRNAIDGNKYASRNLRLNTKQYCELFADKRIPQSIDETSLDRISQRNYNENACRAGVSSCTITPDGSVIPCPAFHLILGNVNESSIKDIYAGIKLDQWKSTTLQDYEECATHDYCDFCAICPGENYTDTGSPLKASYNKCFMAKMRYGYASGIYKKGKSESLKFQTKQ